MSITAGLKAEYKELYGVELVAIDDVMGQSVDTSFLSCEGGIRTNNNHIPRQQENNTIGRKQQNFKQQENMSFKCQI